MLNPRLIRHDGVPNGLIKRCMAADLPDRGVTTDRRRRWTGFADDPKVDTWFARLFQTRDIGQEHELTAHAQDSPPARRRPDRRLAVATGGQERDGRCRGPEPRIRAEVQQRE